MEITQDINHQVAYLQGLAEGYQGKDARETRILAEIVNVLAGMADYPSWGRSKRKTRSTGCSPAGTGVAPKVNLRALRRPSCRTAKPS